MVLVEDRPTLMSLKMAIEEGLDAPLEKALRYWFSKYDENWLEDAKHYIQDTKSSKRNTGELAGLVAFYEQNFKKRYKSKEISGIINQYKHDAQHLQKLIAGLIPVLTRLTAGPLAELLSPSTDPDDPRVLTDLAKVIKNKQGLYVGLDSLSDSVVGSSVAAILLAEAAAVAGDRYNYDPDAKQKPINLFVDEASEVINEPLIQLLNKGRGAGFRIFIATQTVADFEARLGNASKARQVMGNLNNNIILRLKDGDTADYFTEGFGQVPIKKYDVSYRSGVDASVMDEEDTTGAYSEALATEDVDMISSDLIKKLPNLHYFASITGGSVKKVQIPIVFAE
jgi:conjugal transfer pilus assembly protein TraD